MDAYIRNPIEEATPKLRLAFHGEARRDKGFLELLALAADRLLHRRRFT